MTAYTINLIDSITGDLIGSDIIEAKSEAQAIKAAKNAIKTAGMNPADYTFEIQADSLPAPIPAPKLDDAEAPKRIISLDPANSPAIPGEQPRTYPKSIKHPELGTFWGCDQQKLLGTIKLNPHALDGYIMRQTGARTNFYLDSTLIWTTTKPIATLADEMARDLIQTITA